MTDVSMPRRVYVQLTQRCNLRCTMCGWKAWTKHTGEMQSDVFERILRQCLANNISSMRFSSAQGEPLLNPNWPLYARQAIFAGLELNINTNCTPLGLANILKLMRLAQSGKLTIQLSFAGYDKASYEKVYVGSDFELTSDKLRLLWNAIGEYKDQNNEPVLTVRGVVYSKEDEVRSYQHLNSLGIPSERVTMVVPDNFTGKVATTKVTTSRSLCYILVDHIGVYVDGTVTACGSRDSEGDMALGNIMHTGFRELRDSKTYRDMVTAHNELNFDNLPLCKDCDLPCG